jgi:mannosyltransferase
MRDDSGKIRLTAAIILLASMFLRINDLSTESLRYDEGVSILLANSSLHEIIEDRISYKFGHPPLYFFFLHYWVAFFGDTEFSVRIPSVIFGLLSVYLFYRVGGLLFGEETGVLASLLLGVSVFHIGHSQEARMYSLMTLLTLSSMFFFLKLLGRMELGMKIGYVISTILLLYTHVYGLFILMAQGLFILIISLCAGKTNRIDFVGWFMLQTSILVLFTPWMGVLMEQASKILYSGTWIGIYYGSPTIKTLTSSLIEFSGSFRLLIIFLLLSITSIVTIDVKSYSKLGLVIIWLLMPVLLSILISNVLQPIYQTRYLISASLAFYALAARGITGIRNRYVKSAVVFAVIALSLLNVYEYYVGVQKHQWKDLMAYVNKNARPGDLLIYPISVQKCGLIDYYGNRTDLVELPVPKKSYFKPPVQTLDTVKERYDRIWIIHYLSGNYSVLNDHFRETHKLSYSQDYHSRLNLFFFERK